MALKRLQINLEEDLIEQVDAYAARLHISRTAATAVLLSTALQSGKLAETLGDFMDAYREQEKKDLPVIGSK